MDVQRDRMRRLFDEYLLHLVVEKPADDIIANQHDGDYWARDFDAFARRRLNEDRVGDRHTEGADGRPA